MSIKIIRKFQLDLKICLKRDLIGKDCLKWCFTNMVWNVALQFVLFYTCYCINFISAPVFMPSPSVFPLSPYSLNVSWKKPEDNLSRGEVMGYSISLMTEQRFLPTFSQVWFYNKFLVHGNGRNDKVWCSPWCFPDLFSWFLGIYTDVSFSPLKLSWLLCDVIHYSWV